MIRIGKTFGNLMVDLRTTNTKLRARSNRIVRMLTGLSVDSAERLLTDCGGELKTALVSQLGSITPAQAREHLSSVGGHLRKAMFAAKISQHQQRSSQSEAFFLGVDGGGTHTVAMLADQSGKVLGRAEAGPSNFHGIGKDAAIRNIESAITGAFLTAGIEQQMVKVAVLGLSGAGRVEDQQIFLDWGKRVGLAHQVRVVGDMDILLTAGTPEGWGVAVIAGTGSIVCARNQDGRFVRSGGWGPLLGDQGGAYWLVVEALRASMISVDCLGMPTTLTKKFMKFLKCAAPQDLIIATRSMDRSKLASMAWIVLEGFAENDPVSIRIVRDAVSMLVGHTTKVIEQLNLLPSKLPFVLAGGLFRESEHFRTNYLDQLAKSQVGPVSITLVKEPATGAIRMAIEIARTHHEKQG
jgi:N-acetylglucosamine kinase-like BadF-type ATPase